MSGPMNPKRLADLRARLVAPSDVVWADALADGIDIFELADELIDDRDHHVKRAEEEAKRADKAEADARSWKSQADEEFRGQVAAWNEVGR